MSYLRKQKGSPAAGFTIIELMLAMAFFSTILIMTTMVVVQSMNIYNKSIAVKEMNIIGRLLLDDASRVGNSAASGTVTIGPNYTPADKPRCLILNGNAYIWSYSTDTPTNGNAYRWGGSEVINFSRIENSTICPSPGDVSGLSGPFAGVKPESLVGANVKVYATSLRQITPSVVKIGFTLGTHSPIATDNPTVDGAGNWSCPADSLGSVCTLGEFETIVYLANN